ncbi:MAG: hypothetical protein II222_01545 [Paraprevotella sp.]|nr:hypothetical protein [Paraprevotella sp.]
MKKQYEKPQVSVVDIQVEAVMLTQSTIIGGGDDGGRGEAEVKVQSSWPSSKSVWDD